MVAMLLSKVDALARRFGAESGPTGLEDFLMDQIAGGVAGEGGPFILWAEQIAPVNEDAASRRESANVQRGSRPILAQGIDLAAG